MENSTVVTIMEMVVGFARKKEGEKKKIKLLINSNLSGINALFPLNPLKHSSCAVKGKSTENWIGQND